MFQCPDQSYPIERAVHLGRLMRSYAACRTCPQRHDLAGLLPTQQRRIAASTAERGGWRLRGASIEGTLHNDLDAAAVRRLAIGLGLHLLETGGFAGSSTVGGRGAPAVVLAGDERPQTAALVAAACEGLRYAGCRVFHVGGATAAAAGAALLLLEAGTALLVGNPTRRRHRAGLTFAFRPSTMSAARPASGNDLEAILGHAARWADRPARRFGPLGREHPEPAYLAALAPRFHALRPLVVVLDSASIPLRRYVSHLARNTACRFVEPLEGESTEHGVAWPPLASPDAAHDDARLAAAVCRAGADFGISTDGDGGQCHVVDEGGEWVSPGRLAAVLPEADPDHDGLTTLALLLGLLSRSDDPLSRILPKKLDIAARG